MRGVKPRLGQVVFPVMTLFMAGWTSSAWAQFGAHAVITVPGSVTSDQSVETSTGDIDNRQLPPIVTSLTTTTAGSNYTSNSGTIASLDQSLFAGVNPQNDATLMPVTQGLPCDSYDYMVGTVAPALMKTYINAISIAQQQENELAGEDFSTIASNIQAPEELAATQGVGQAVLAAVGELQLIRQQLDTLIMVSATENLHRLDSSVRALMPRGCQ